MRRKIYKTNAIDFTDKINMIDILTDNISFELCLRCNNISLNNIIFQELSSTSTEIIVMAYSTNPNDHFEDAWKLL